jgi:DivIVA domain-containing protein
MERLEPTDLENADFKRVLRGYDMVEVHKMLQRAAREIATLRNELNQAKAQNDKPHVEVAKPTREANAQTINRAQERQLEAEHEVVQMIEAARRQADEILCEAHQRVLDVEQRHNAHLTDLKWQIERITIERDKIVNCYREFLTEQLNLIDNSASTPYVTLTELESSPPGAEDGFATNIDESPHLGDTGASD